MRVRLRDEVRGCDDGGWGGTAGGSSEGRGARRGHVTTEACTARRLFLQTRSCFNSRDDSMRRRECFQLIRSAFCLFRCRLCRPCLQHGGTSLSSHRATPHATMTMTQPRDCATQHHQPQISDHITHSISGTKQTQSVTKAQSIPPFLRERDVYVFPLSRGRFAFFS